MDYTFDAYLWNNVEQKQHLRTNLWYFPDVSKPEAIELLMKQPTGTYLVSCCTEGKHSVLSIRCDNKDKPVAQYKIFYDPSKRFFIHPNLQTDSIEELIAYYQNDKENKLNLLQPLKSICPKPPRVHVPFMQIVHSSKVTLQDKITHGFFGPIHKGQYGQYHFAIKEIQTSNTKALKKQTEALLELRHKNVVTLYGQCEDKDWYIFELVDNCLLDQLQKATYNNNHILAIATQIARGMNYLHNQNFIHGDLAARNILITSNLEAKISDFGLSKKLKAKRVRYCAGGSTTPYLWEALETLTKDETSKPSDVWMFGVLLFELYTNGAKPMLGSYRSGVVLNKDNFIQLLMQGQRLEKPDKMADNIFVLQQTCMLEKPHHRPDFEQILWFFN